MYLLHPSIFLSKKDLKVADIGCGNAYALGKLTVEHETDV